jgi:O-antigen/teichoic acid export membrane protein
VLVLALIEPITRLVFGPQWTAAIPIFLLLWPGSLVVPTTIALLALLTAVGDTRTGFAFAILWALGTWLLGVPLVLAFGAIGYGLTTLAVQTTALALFRRARERAPFRLLPVIAPAWLSAGIVGVVIYTAARVRPCTNVIELGAYAGTGLAIYVVGVWLIAPRETRQLWAWVRGRA